ncbi:MAG: SGNH/GDSL hydrolase family protein [Clostridia bacterium]|nr:SGNH/GDSL hydrolase family protein [Clostridia bacterium]
MELKQILTPVWDTETVYGESFLMIKGEPAPFLFEPLEILKVTNAAETEVYKPEKDYKIENGQLWLTPHSRIFAFERAELYPAEGVEGRSFPLPEGYLLFSEGHFFHDRQIAVTYTCKKGGWQGVRPVSAKAQLPRTFGLLERGAPLTLLAYGDSITAGGNASKIIDAPPYQPSYSELVALGLEARYGAKINYINTAVGGKKAAWGLEEAAERAAAHRPDLMILAFGMNNGKTPLEELQAQLRGIIEETRKGNPETEVILVATSTPNPMMTHPKAKFWGNQQEQKPYLDALAAEMEGVAVADITGMQRFLHSKKRFIDTTGNHVNHPNDFFHRLYAQFILGML